MQKFQPTIETELFPGSTRKTVRSWRARTLTLCAALLLTASSGAAARPIPSPAQVEADVPFVWMEATHTLENAPKELSGAARKALADWGPWAKEHGYVTTLSDDEHVLLLVPGKKPKRKTWKLFEESLATFDRLVPEADGPLRVAARDASSGGPTEPAELACAVLVEAKTQADYEALVERAVRLEPYLAGWAAQGKQAAGVVLQRPLLAAWLKNPDGVDEWDPANELVHRLGHVLTLRRFGELPHWLARGLAWTLELEVEGDVACFPDRTSFVYAVEHGAWPSQAKNLARKQDDGVALDDLAAWKRGTWDGDRAVLAWAVTNWIVSAKPEVVPALLTELAHAREEGSIVRYPDGSWTSVPDFRLDAAAQRALFARYLGADFETEWTAAIAGRKARKR